MWRLVGVMQLHGTFLPALTALLRLISDLPTEAMTCHARPPRMRTEQHDEEPPHLLPCGCCCCWYLAN